MGIEIEGNAVRCTVNAAEPWGRGSYEVTMRATATSFERVRGAGEFASRLPAGDELRALRAMVMEMADLIIRQKTELEALEALEPELDESGL